jgi:hypothetical protein
MPCQTIEVQTYEHGVTFWILQIRKLLLFPINSPMHLRSIVNMDEEELESHHETLRLIQRDLQFSQWNAAEVEHKEDK